MAREVSLEPGHREVCLSAQAQEAAASLDCRAAYLVLVLVQAHTVSEVAVITTAMEDSAKAVRTATRVVQDPEEGSVSAAGFREQVRLLSEAHLEVAQEVSQMARTKEVLVVRTSAESVGAQAELTEGLAQLLEAPWEVQGAVPLRALMTLMEVTTVVGATLLALQVEASAVVLDAGVEAWVLVEAPMTNLQKDILAAATEEVVMGCTEDEKEDLVELVDPALDEGEALVEVREFQQAARAALTASEQAEAVP